ncbi:MAG: hypothetical protein ACO25F_08755 [Erythrobacter sp.]
MLQDDNHVLVASFSDAAALRLSPEGQGKRAVNPDALGRLKACDGIEQSAQGEASESD